jgi:type IV pilus assembly protein PilM
MAQHVRADGLDVVGGDEAPSFDLNSVVESVCEELSMAIERSVVYLKTSGDTERITRILLSGGGVRIPGILDFLSRRHQGPVETADPLKRIQFDEAIFEGQDAKVMGPSLAVGIGLALRKVDDR